MKKLACASMGMACPFVAEGETDEEVMGKLTEHGMSAHPEEVGKMMSEMGEDAMKEKMRANIQEA